MIEWIIAHISSVMATKWKTILYSIFWGIIITYFEIQLWNVKFNLAQNIKSIIIIVLITQIATLFTNHLGLSIMFAFFWWITVPFVLRKDIRLKFANDALKRWGFRGVKTENLLDDSELFK